MDKKNIEQFKQGIFSLRTNFGELAQLMIKKDFGLQPADDNSYDLKDGSGNKIEVKFSRAYKRGIKLTEKNVIEICTQSGSTVYSSKEAMDKTADYDCNIQQLKPYCFDFLFYGIFFSDKIEIFLVDRSIFPKNLDNFKQDKSSIREKLPGYATQHKGGNECQFHIKKTTYKHHKDHYFLKAMTYEELYDLLTSKK